MRFRSRRCSSFCIRTRWRTSCAKRCSVAPMFTARWRWNASRALALLRFRGGRKVPAPIQRMRAEDLLASVFPDQVACAENLTGPIRIPDHPLVNETIDNCLHEAMDLEGLRRCAGRAAGWELFAVWRWRIPRLRCFRMRSQRQSVRVSGRCAAGRAPRARRAIAQHAAHGCGAGAGILDPAAIEQIAAEVWPEPRDADELHDALLTFDRWSGAGMSGRRGSRNCARGRALRRRL